MYFLEMVEIFDFEFIVIICGLDDYSCWEFGCFYVLMIDFMFCVIGYDDDEVFIEDVEIMV